MKDLEPNQTIGNYRVIRRIGRGGMGSVYEVESLDLHERYALKTFTYDPADDDGDVLKNKFLEEGKILARLRHPNIAHVYSLAYDQGLELLYFVMDLVLSEDGLPYSVENASFAELEEDTALAWFTDVCEALDYIHSQGIVHRDIKPANLLVKLDGHVVLTDFGIAKIRSGKMKDEVNPAMTMRIDGNITVLGSNHYIAPEVEMGGEVTPAADAYSLGVMMFEMLTGRWYDKVEDPWPLLDGRRYPWKRVLSMLLAEDPENRPLGYAEIAKRMPTWKGEDTPVVHPPKAEPESDEAPAGKNGVPVVAVSVTAFVLIGIGVAAWCLLKPSAEPEISPVVVPVVDPAPEPVRFDFDEKQVEEDPEVDPVAAPVAAAESERPVEVNPEAYPDVPKALPEATKPAESVPVEVNPEAYPDVPKAVPEATKPAESVPVVVIPDRTYSWRLPAMTEVPARPVEVDFMLASGPKLTFCAVPKAGVWFSKYCVTSLQCREFLEPEVPEICQALEKEYGDFPIYCSFTLDDWRAYCRQLTARYRQQIPSGWVFRLATVEEFDTAFFCGPRRGDEGVSAAKYNAGNAKIVKSLAEKLKSGGKRLIKGMDNRGFMIKEDVCLGGNTEPNPLGIHDFWLDGWHQLTTDGVSGSGILRSGRKSRADADEKVCSRAHIVLGPVK